MAKGKRINGQTTIYKTKEDTKRGGQSKRTDNTMANRKMIKGQTAT